MTTPDTAMLHKNLCERAVHIMADGSLEDFEAVVHPQARNREDVREPPECRERGPAAFYATALWLREAYANLHWEIHEVVAEDDIVTLHATMSGRHVGDLRRLRRRRPTGAGLPADGQDVRHDADPLVPHCRRKGHRALGQSRRPRHFDAARLDTALARVPRADGAGHSSGPAGRRAVCHTRTRCWGSLNQMDEVERGQTIVVTRGGRRIAAIGPISASNGAAVEGPAWPAD